MAMFFLPVLALQVSFGKFSLSVTSMTEIVEVDIVGDDSIVWRISGTRIAFDKIKSAKNGKDGEIVLFDTMIDVKNAPADVSPRIDARRICEAVIDINPGTRVTVRRNALGPLEIRLARKRTDTATRDSEGTRRAERHRPPSGQIRVVCLDKLKSDLPADAELERHILPKKSTVLVFDVKYAAERGLPIILAVDTERLRIGKDVPEYPEVTTRTILSGSLPPPAPILRSGTVSKLAASFRIEDLGDFLSRLLKRGWPWSTKADFSSSSVSQARPQKTKKSEKNVVAEVKLEPGDKLAYDAKVIAGNGKAPAKLALARGFIAVDERPALRATFHIPSERLVVTRRGANGFVVVLTWIEKFREIPWIQNTLSTFAALLSLLLPARMVGLVGALDTDDE